MCVFHVVILLSFLSYTLYTIYSGLISMGKICGYRVPREGQLGFSVASCGHGSRTDDAESHARQEWSVFQGFSKSRA